MLLVLTHTHTIDKRKDFHVLRLDNVWQYPLKLPTHGPCDRTRQLLHLCCHPLPQLQLQLGCECVSKHKCDEQYDQMATNLLAQYLAIYNNENWPNTIKN